MVNEKEGGRRRTLMQFINNMKGKNSYKHRKLENAVSVNNNGYILKIRHIPRSREKIKLRQIDR